MCEWEEVNKGKKFISDLGKSSNITVGDVTQLMGRYAVWVPTDDGRHQVVEVGDNVEILKKKYDIPQERIYLAAL